MELILDPFATDDPSLVGECSHIVAEKPTGTRGDSTLTAKQRNRYRNLILLCNVHHKQVDDQPTHFTVERLHEMKRAHESWVRTQLAGFDVQKQEDDERWAGYIEEWSARSDLNNWLVNTSHLLSSDPQVDAHFFAALKEIPVWVLSRVWPKSAPDLRATLENYSSVVNDLLNEFAKHSKPDSSGEMIETIRFYRIEDYDEERYHRLLKQFNFHVDLLHDLVFELTKPAIWSATSCDARLTAHFVSRRGFFLFNARVVSLGTLTGSSTKVRNGWKLLILESMTSYESAAREMLSSRTR